LIKRQKGKREEGRGGVLTNKLKIEGQRDRSLLQTCCVKSILFKKIINKKRQWR
jgi:hypothetical protein